MSKITSELFRKNTSPATIGAFSLMEVVIAIGVSTFAMVGLMGLVPISIDSARASVNETRAAQIAQRLLADYQGQSFSGVAFPLYSSSGSSTGQTLSPALNLTALGGTSSPTLFQANINGELMVNQGGQYYFIDPPSEPVDSTPAYYIGVTYNNSSTGFDSGSTTNVMSNLLDVRVSWDLQSGSNVSSSRYHADFTSVITDY